MIRKLFVVVCIMGLLTACGGNDEAEKESTKDEAKAGQKEGKKARGDFTTAEELETMDFDSKDFNWNDIYLSAETFNELLFRFTEADDQGELLLERAELVEFDTVELVFNNYEGNSLENSLQAVFLDSVVRQFYKHSELYEGEEPHIRVIDLDGLVIAENKEPIKFGEVEKKKKES
ncbi:hypothetical protein [Bacillus sp. FJAT-45066]|uniref:hypothetical protein n=1 Tax=Bacillus sp. FJAT-45066 TaxID=2011010 RepID=UPI000BB6BEE2|nr:hypothetical protein [Bacillus sp. FJAT-45066]